MRRLPVLAGVATAAMVAFGSVAYSRRVDVQATTEYGKELQTLLALDFRLNSEVLKARAGSVSHYDGIVQAEAALTRVHDNLRRVPPFLGVSAAADLLRSLQRSRGYFEESRELVERFKRENAVLRNSLRYLPVLARDLNEAATLQPEQAAFSHELDALVRDELLLQGWHDPSVAQRVTAAAEHLEASAAIDANENDERITAALTHVRIVVERTAAVNALMRAIVEQPTVPVAQRMIAAFAKHHDTAIGRTEQDAFLFFVLALLAFGLAAASVIKRLSDSARALRVVGTQLAEANAALQVEQARQQELNNLKSRFVSMTSHEFRTPLSTILSSTDLLSAYAERWSPEKREEHLGRIRHAVLGMTRMLDGILMIGRSDAGVLEFNPQPVDLVRICEKAIEGASSLSRSHHAIVYEGPSSTEPVQADAALLTNVIDNLLSNAVKYSPTGGAVTLKLARDPEHFRVEVSDEGIGIPEGDQGHLFDTFRRGSNVGTISGTGLGLAIVKRAVDLHGGTVSIKSAKGRGTTFTVEVPCGSAQA